VDDSGGHFNLPYMVFNIFSFNKALADNFEVWQKGGRSIALPALVVALTLQTYNGVKYQVARFMYIHKLSCSQNVQ
jgi:lipocalin